MSYVVMPFLRSPRDPLVGHTNYWESKAMVETFLERGYSVDLIDTTNHTFVPSRGYDYFVDNGSNMDRLVPLLNADCTKVFHITTSHWQFQNNAEHERALRVLKTRGVALPPDRELPPMRAIELCDVASMLGNNATASTYAFANKPITQLPISTTHLYPSPEHKDFEKIKKNFIWFGGAGALHKGLDLVLEAFAAMPEFNLVVCGKISAQDMFAEVYKHELYECPNIKTIGWIDPGSEQFKTLCENAVGLIYPSCAEGQSGGVVLSMHAGLIPIISYQSGVDVGDFGIILKENTVEEIQTQMKLIAEEPAYRLKERAAGAWRYARAHHTREMFGKAYRSFVTMLESTHRA